MDNSLTLRVTRVIELNLYQVVMYVNPTSIENGYVFINIDKNFTANIGQVLKQVISSRGWWFIVKVNCLLPYQHAQCKAAAKPEDSYIEWINVQNDKYITGIMYHIIKIFPMTAWLSLEVSIWYIEMCHKRSFPILCNWLFLVPTHSLPLWSLIIISFIYGDIDLAIIPGSTVIFHIMILMRLFV